MAQKKNTAEAVREVAQPVAASMGLVLWDVVFVKEGPSWFLRLLIDKPGGIFIDDCERLSRAVDPLIEQLNPTDQEYFLEVSSPGLARTLRTDAHLNAYIGKAIKIKRYHADADSQREFFGSLCEFDAESITLKTETETIQVKRNDIADIKADDDRDLFGGHKK